MKAGLQPWLLELASILDEATRNGELNDEPEGVRWIQLSDTLARQLSEDAKSYAKLLAEPTSTPMKLPPQLPDWFD